MPEKIMEANHVVGSQNEKEEKQQFFPKCKLLSRLKLPVYSVETVEDLRLSIDLLHQPTKKGRVEVNPKYVVRLAKKVSYKIFYFCNEHNK